MDHRNCGQDHKTRFVKMIVTRTPRFIKLPFWKITATDIASPISVNPATPHPRGVFFGAKKVWAKKKLPRLFETGEPDNAWINISRSRCSTWWRRYSCTVATWNPPDNPRPMAYWKFW